MKKYLVIAALAVVGALFALPGIASAHHVTLESEVSCLEDDGSWSVTWTATNSENNKVMDITDTDLVGDSNTSGGFDQNPADPTFSPNPVPSSGSATAVTEHGSGTARVRLSVTGDWVGAGENTDTETVNKPTQLCNPHVHGTASLNGEVSCVGANGSFSITWTFTNNSTHHTMDIGGTELTDGNVAPDPAFSDQTNIAAAGSVTATTNYASGAGVSSSITLEVTYSLDDDGTSASFEVSKSVSKPTTPCITPCEHDPQLPANDPNCRLVEVCVDGVVSTYPASQAPEDTGDCDMVEVCVDGEMVEVTEYEANNGADTGDCDIVEVCVDGQIVEATEYEVNEGIVVATEDCNTVQVCVNGEFVQATQFEIDEGIVVATDDCQGITIRKDTNPETNNVDFDFDGDLGDFDLEDDESITFNLAVGSYTVEENLFGDWVLADIVCNGGNVDIDEDDARVTIHLGVGQHVTCTFVNDPDDDDDDFTPDPTPSPSPSPSPVPPTVPTQVSEVSPAVSEVLPARLPATGTGPERTSYTSLIAVAVVALLGLGATGLMANRRKS